MRQTIGCRRIIKQYYAKNVTNTNNIINNNFLAPGYLSGFIDGEGCFHISVVKSSSTKTK